MFARSGGRFRAEASGDRADGGFAVLSDVANVDVVSVAIVVDAMLGVVFRRTYLDGPRAVGGVRLSSCCVVSCRSVCRGMLSVAGGRVGRVPQAGVVGPMQRSPGRVFACDCTCSRGAPALQRALYLSKVRYSVLAGPC